MRWEAVVRDEFLLQVFQVFFFFCGITNLEKNAEGGVGKSTVCETELFS